MLGADRGTEANEDVLAGGRDVDVAIAGLEHAGWNAGRVIVAGLRRHLFGDEPARRLEVGQRDLRLKQRGAHPLALAGYLALAQRNQEAERATESGPQVGDRDA